MESVFISALVRARIQGIMVVKQDRMSQAKGQEIKREEKENEGKQAGVKARGGLDGRT